jgi:hypothetical protein
MAVVVAPEGDDMPRRIDELVWRALTDVSFREGLMNGQRRELVDAMGLTGEEREAVLAVEAKSLEGFAGALCRCCDDSVPLQGYSPA